MKKVVETTEVEGEGLEAFLNEQIFIICRSYFYTGKLMGVNTDCILLEGAEVVLESGSLSGSTFTTTEKVAGNKIYITKNSIEAFFPSNRK